MIRKEYFNEVILKKNCGLISATLSR